MVFQPFAREPVFYMVTGEKKESAEAAGSSLLSKRRKKSAPSFHGTILLRSRERVNCSRRAFGENRETVSRATFVLQLICIIRSGSSSFRSSIKDAYPPVRPNGINCMNSIRRDQAGVPIIAPERKYSVTVTKKARSPSRRSFRMQPP